MRTADSIQMSSLHLHLLLLLELHLFRILSGQRINENIIGSVMTVLLSRL